VKSYVTGPSTKCYFDEFMFMSVSLRMIKENTSTVVSVRSVVIVRFCVRPTSERWLLKIVCVTVKRDPFDAL
jgi:hypothetical protein